MKERKYEQIMLDWMKIIMLVCNLFTPNQRDDRQIRQDRYKQFYEHFEITEEYSHLQKLVRLQLNWIELNWMNLSSTNEKHRAIVNRLKKL